MVFESNTLDMLVLHEGVTKYFWVKYSMYPQGIDPEGNVSMTDESDDAVYIGICYNQVSTDESDNPADYQWSKIHGDDGAAAFTVILSNENVSFSTTEDNIVIETQKYVCGVQVFQGLKQITEFTIDEIPEQYDGIDVEVLDHQVIITAEAGNRIPVEYGVFTINADIVGETPVAGEEPITTTIPVYKELSWNLSKQGITGIPGFSVVIGNESQNIPCDKNGYVLEDMQLEIPFYAFEGLGRVWCSATYGALPDGVHYAGNLSDEVSEVDSPGVLVFNIDKGATLGAPEILTGKFELVFTISSDLYGERQTSKYFSWTKSLQGIDGILTLYEIKPSCEFMTRSAVEYSDTQDYKIMPETVTFSANYTQTMNEGKHEFEGFFILEETISNVSTSVIYQSTEAESSVSYTPSNTSATNVKCTLYEKDDFMLELDVVNIPIISDGSVYDAIQTLHTEMKGVKSIIDPNSDPPMILEQAWANSQIKVTNTATGETVSQTFTDWLSQHETTIYGVEQRVQETETTLKDNTLTLEEHKSVIDQHAKDITIAVSSANSALSQLDNKNSNFTTKTPEETISPPYVKGDLWVRTVYVYDEDGSIKTDDAGNEMVETVVYQCNTTVEVGGSFDESHWEIADYATTGYVESAIELEANKMELIVSDSGKVTPASIVLAINENDQSDIKISAENLELDGYVTFKNLETSGETIIDGGNIKTGSITSDHIATGSITADDIQSGSITGDRIASHTLTSEQIDVNSLFAEEIDATNGSIKNATMTNAKIESAEINNCTINSSLKAENLVGKISDKTGKNSWNLSTGELIISGNNSGNFVTDSDLSTQGSTSINGGNVSTGTISADRLDVTGIFAKDVTASGTITGAKITGGTITGGTIDGANITSTSDAGHKANLYGGSLTFDGKVNGYSSVSAAGATFYGQNKSSTEPECHIGRKLVKIYTKKSTNLVVGESTTTSAGFCVERSDGSAMYMNDHTLHGHSKSTLDWEGDANIASLTVGGINTFGDHIYNADNTGYVYLGKSDGYYYFRPYVKDKVILGSSSNPWESLHSDKAYFYDLGTSTSTDISSTSYPVVRWSASSNQLVKYTPSGSSKRFKTDIIDGFTDETLNPHNLYDVNLYQYKYKENHLDKDDQRFGQDLYGFIVENLIEYYPIAVTLDDKGRPADWNEKFLIPPMLKLIQEQHEEIEGLKETTETIKSENESLKSENELLKSQLTSILERLDKLEAKVANEVA